MGTRYQSIKIPHDAVEENKTFFKNRNIPVGKVLEKFENINTPAI